MCKGDNMSQPSSILTINYWTTELFHFMKRSSVVAYISLCLHYDLKGLFTKKMIWSEI